MRLAALALALSSVTTYAHHSIERTYDLKTEVRLTGTVRQLLLRNPHSFLQIEVPDQEGMTQIWSLEFPKGASSLFKQGIQPGTLKIGDRITVTANPSFYNPTEKRGNMVTLHRDSDGFEWSAKMKRTQS